MNWEFSLNIENEMGNSRKEGSSHFKLNMNDWDIQFPKVPNDLGKHFPLRVMEWSHWKFFQYHNCFSFSQDFVYTTHSFLRTLLITIILYERYMGCLIKIQNNS